jgi:hypothetical protein
MRIEKKLRAMRAYIALPSYEKWLEYRKLNGLLCGELQLNRTGAKKGLTCSEDCPFSTIPNQCQIGSAYEHDGKFKYLQYEAQVYTAAMELLAWCEVNLGGSDAQDRGTGA